MVMLPRQSRSANVKREQKKSLFFRTITQLIMQVTQDEPGTNEVFVTRVDFSADMGICYVYFAAYQADQGEKVFDTVLETLKLYKPSLRKALAKSIPGRYTPDLVFLFDATKDKERRINDLLNKVQEEFEQSDAQDDGNEVS